MEAGNVKNAEKGAATLPTYRYDDPLGQREGGQTEGGQTEG